MTTTRTISVALLVASSTLLVYLTAVLPYWFPPQVFIVGASNEVGFSNAVSFLAYLTCIPLMAWVMASLLPAPRALEACPDRADGYFAGVVCAVVAFHVVVFAALFAYKGRFVFGEALYFQSLLYRMSIGERPYFDFSFYYGPLMLYPAFWLTRLFSLDLAYGLWFVSTYVVGLLFLATVIRVILTGWRVRAFWFCLLAAGLFNPLTGLNETFTRFLFPSIVFLSVADFLQRGGAGRGLWAVSLLAAAVTYSFEVAVLSIAAVGCLWAAMTWLGTPSRRTVVSRAAMLIVAGGALSSAFFLIVDPTGGALREYPAIARSYSAGAHNVPIYPHLPFIALAGVTIVTLAALLKIVRHDGNRLVVLTAVVYAAIAVIAQRAAFGAAEPSHFGYFGLPMFCLALFLTTLMPGGRTSRTWLAGVLVIGIMLPMQYYYANEFVPFLRARIRPAAVKAPPTGGGAASSSDLERSLRDLVRAVGSDRPYLMPDLEYASLPVYRDLGLRYPTYFTMLINARDHEGIERSIAEVRRSGAVVVVRKQDVDGPSRTDRASATSRWLDLLSGAHTANSDLNEILQRSQRRLTRPFLDFVRREYVVLYDRDGLVAYGPGNR